tara:strand:+ start:636 stop:962 length:327 start_codon:yes stop_codon:yes gene_type:complete
MKKRKNQSYKVKLQFDEQALLEQILSLPLKHQPIIARVIWWDFFAGRLTSNRSTMFDKWLKFDHTQVCDEPSPADLVKSLMSFGYPLEISTRRFAPKFKKQLKSDIKK